VKRASAVGTSGVPIVLPTVEIRIDDAGFATVAIDKEPYEVPGTFRRDGVRRLVQDLANTHGPIRVVITESDGETYIDIETPREDASAPPPGPVYQPEPQSSTGPFSPGEDVLVAVVVDRRTPGSDGTVSLRIPPAITRRYGGAVYLIGHASHVVIPLTDVDQERL
jgi:hypothetical protein